MKNLLVLTAILAFCVSQLKAQIVRDAFGNEYIMVNKDFIRGDISFTQMNLAYKGIPTRTGAGIHTKLAGGIVSSFICRQHRIMLYDEFYLHISMGKLTSKSLLPKGGESSLVTAFMFGYEVLLGYNAPLYAVYGGVRFNFADAFVGSSQLTGDKFMNYTHPWMLRGEYKIKGSPYFKFVVMAWSNFEAHTNYSGFNIDAPVSRHKRLWLTFQYDHLEYPNSSPATFDNGVYTPGNFNQWFVGIKVGSLH